MISRSTVTISILTLLLYSCSKENIEYNQKTTHDTLAITSAQNSVSTNNFNWINWYLSVPIKNKKNKATSIYYKDLEAGNFTKEQNKYVTKNPNGSYTFNTRYTEYTTSGKYSTNTKGKYCRTELREYYRGNQSTKDNWSMESGVHKMESRMIVDYCQGNSRTFVGQIHGYGNNNPATVKVAWDKGVLKLEYYIKPKSGDKWTSKYIKKVDLARVDQEEFTLGIQVRNGVLSCSVKCSTKGINTGYKTFYDYKKNGYASIYTNYFKTGNYFNWNKDKSKTCQVTMYGINTTHNSNTTISEETTTSAPTDNQDSTSQDNTQNQLLPNGKYSLLSPFLNEGLTSYNSYKGDTKMAKRKTSDNSQNWEIEHLGDNVYILKNLHTKRYLEVQNNKFQNNANVGTSTSAKNNNQKWYIEKKGDYYILKANHCRTRAIDRENGKSKANAQIYWYNTKNNNQKWIVKKQ